MVSKNLFLESVEKNGYFHFKSAISKDKIKLLNEDTIRTLKLKNPYVKKNYFYVAHNFSSNLLKFLEYNPIQKYVDLIMGKNCIIHSYSAVNLPPSENNIIQNKIHRDTARFCRPYLLSSQIIVLLDDFTKKNGATYFYPKSHFMSKKPSRKDFNLKSFQIEGRAGDIIFFDSLMWHCGGINKTKFDRKCLTVVYNRPFMKQQIDLSSATKKNIKDKIGKQTKRLLGFNARVPKNIKEFNLPLNERHYKPNQE